MSQDENGSETVYALPLSEKPVVESPARDEAKIIGHFDKEQTQLIRERQASRSKMMGIILLSLCVLFFAITIVKIGVWG